MKFPEMSNTRRRVKLYVLNEERQWDDHGTGHVSSMYVDHEKMQGIVLLVRSEDDGRNVLFTLIMRCVLTKEWSDYTKAWGYTPITWMTLDRICILTARRT